MKKIKEILDTVVEEFTMEEFWVVVDALPDEGDGKKQKDNVKAHFKRDGTPKAKALSPISPKDYQDIYDAEVFISTTVEKEIHLNKLRHHVEVHKQHIKDVREEKTKRMKVVKYGKLEKIERKNDG